MNWNPIHSTLNLTFSIWIKLSKLTPQILPERTEANENDTSVSLSHQYFIWGFATITVTAYTLHFLNHHQKKTKKVWNTQSLEHLHAAP